MRRERGGASSLGAGGGGCRGHRQQWGQGGAHKHLEQESQVLAGAEVDWACGELLVVGGAGVVVVLAEASNSARRSSSKGVPASASMFSGELMPRSSTPACTWAIWESTQGAAVSFGRPPGSYGAEREAPGNAGCHAAQAKTITRCKTDHRGAQRSHAAAMDRSSHAGISHIEATSQGLLPASRKLAAEPRCKPPARDKSTVHAVKREVP